jgi:hypothetical protein
MKVWPRQLSTVIPAYAGLHRVMRESGTLEDGVEDVVGRKQSFRTGLAA